MRASSTDVGERARVRRPQGNSVLDIVEGSLRRGLLRARRGDGCPPATRIAIIFRAAGFTPHQRPARVYYLNSERIKQEFGSFGIDVLECSTERRVSNLYSFEDGRKICRTHAVVEFNPAALGALQAEHARVLAGESIGAVFKSRGWTINKRHTQLGSVTLTPRDAAIAKFMQVEPPQQVALHSYIFEVRSETSALEYATITELHHPHYLTEVDVRAIYGEDPPQASQVHAG